MGQQPTTAGMAQGNGDRWRHNERRHKVRASIQPLVSIVIPHFNRASLLAETLASVRAQDYPAWEVIVADDGSNEMEWAALQEFVDEHVRLVKRTDGIKGPSRCRNLGAAQARGEFLLFLDSDDLLAPWCLSQRIGKALAEPGHGLWIFHVLLFRRLPGDLQISWNRLEGEDDLERFLRGDPPWHTSSPLWHKAAFIGIGGFNERVMYGDDADLHVRALLQGVPMQKSPASLPDVFIRRGDARRITNTSSEALAESRRTRLMEGSRLLREANAAAHLHDLWAGQYFVEAEELLFNADSAHELIGEVLASWVAMHRPTLLQRMLVRMYFATGLSFRRHAYVLLRLTRRLAMRVLPLAFFPRGGEFQSRALDLNTTARLEEALESAGRISRSSGLNERLG